MICDFAEYYNIIDYRSLEPRTVGILACGLRGSSRVMGAISGIETPHEQLLLARILDGVNWLVWSNTKDGQKNVNHPVSVFEALLNKDKPKQSKGYATVEEYEKAREEIIKR